MKRRPNIGNFGRWSESRGVASIHDHAWQVTIEMIATRLSVVRCAKETDNDTAATTSRGLLLTHRRNVQDIHRLQAAEPMRPSIAAISVAASQTVNEQLQRLGRCTAAALLSIDKDNALEVQKSQARGEFPCSRLR